MTVSEAQLRASAKYKRERTKQLSLRFYPQDMDVWEWLCAQENKQGYVRDLIRADMEKHKGR